MDRGGRRGTGAPFYVPLRRKTSAEIISEARAAIYGEMSGASSGKSVSGGGALRPLRTRRPFTPHEPQRTLFHERAKHKDPRPPSAFDLKHLTLAESNEESLGALGARVASLDEAGLDELLEETHNAKKKPLLRNQPRSVQERSGDGWNGFPKLPHLSGRSKPLHRRNTTNSTSDTAQKTDQDLSQAISIIRPLGGTDGEDLQNSPQNKSFSPDSGSGSKYLGGNKSVSCNTNNNGVGEIGVKHLAVQVPHASTNQYEGMTILEISEALTQRKKDLDRTLLLLEALLRLLDRSTPANSLKELVLRALYTHIDCEDERILVAIARAMFMMRVTGTHLAAACKLVFKIARNDKNDHFFKNTNLLELLVEGCGRADPVSESECCVYGAGALRFLALEPTLRRRAHQAGALHLAALHLKILNNAKSENPRGVSEGCNHAVYQVTGALRNLASCDAHEFVHSNALAELVNALQLHTDRDLLTNVARCLSVLSAEESCCAWLCASAAAARALVRALAACGARPPLAVRLAYALGNMAAAEQTARDNIYNEEGSIDVLLTILESYTNRNEHNMKSTDADPDVHLVGTDLGGSDGSKEDVLIKTVRVIANLCLTERAGRGIAANHSERTVKALLACLKLAELPSNEVIIERSAERREELATAALATLNNITFYRDSPDLDDSIDDTLTNICKVTCRWISFGGAASCEAVRALGNVSRVTYAAQLIVLEGAIDQLEPYLLHEEPCVRCAAAGVLVNVCGAGAGGWRAAEACAAALARAARIGDAPVAALLARALWNANAHAPLPTHTAHEAATALARFIDDESVFAACQASKFEDRCASDPALFKHHVKFDLHNNNHSKPYATNDTYKTKFTRTVSVDRDLNIEEEQNGYSDDLGFEDGDIDGEECDCEPCKRLTAWEELVGVAIPLLEKLRPPRADASVGTE
ncbi:hypothetical protein K1T71_011161 [Dendrolimus kikuchii]|uniref:Uncharacterized protein n=1 Tax=Dendrolimus kikuchii TaxID=765133 RepID=A0ACC1CMZ7_9NEOP|nr:hypothetical protein K1T71_011161 [Dendrolimus kikuchii]